MSADKIFRYGELEAKLLRLRAMNAQTACGTVGTAGTSQNRWKRPETENHVYAYTRLKILLRRGRGQQSAREKHEPGRVNDALFALIDSSA